jgi:hypothetical protein
MRYLLFYISVYNFIYPIRLNFIPYSEYFFYLPVFIFFLFNKKHINKLILNKKLEFIYITLIVLILISLISTTIFGSFDFLGAFAYFKIIFAIIYTIILNVWGYFIFKTDYETKVFNLFSFFALIVSMSCLLEFFIPAFKSSLIGIFDYTGKISSDGFRVRGFTSGGSSLTFGLYTAILYTILSIHKSNKITHTIFYLVSILIILFSMIFIGRAGLFLAFLFFIFYFLRNLFKPKYLIVNSFLMVFVLSISLSLLNLLEPDQQKLIFSYSLEPINKFLMYGEVSSKSTTHILENMIYFPDLKHLIIGAGYWRYPINDYYLSDIGYFKILISTGLIGLILFFSTYYYLLKKLYQKFKSINKFIIIFLIISFFIFELKEEVFTQNYAFKMLMILITMSLFNLNKKKINE